MKDIYLYIILYNIKIQPTLYEAKIKNPNVMALRRYVVTPWFYLPLMLAWVRDVRGNAIFRVLRPRWCVLSPKEVNCASSRFSGLKRAFKAIFWNELYPKDIKLVGSRATDWDFSWFIRQGECIPIEIWIGWASAPFLWLNWGRCATVLQCYSCF